jgi:hypothetical protein
MGDISTKWLEDGQQGAHGESIAETRGLAQALVLYSGDANPPPKFMFHEMPLTDGVGHDYGPHSDGQRAALDEDDVRIGRILRVLEERGLFDSTLFIVTTDHGMAPTDASLKADQVQAVPDSGMKAVVCAPCIYLIDMMVVVTPHEDGRTAMVEVLANDAGASGEHPPVEGAEVIVSGREAEVLARARTSAAGVCGVPLPANADPADLYLTVDHDDYNPRHLRLDGTPVHDDLRHALFGT